MTVPLSAFLIWSIADGSGGCGGGGVTGCIVASMKCRVA